MPAPSDCRGPTQYHFHGVQQSAVPVLLQDAPLVRQLETVYERGVKLTQLAFRPIAARLRRANGLRKWSVSIVPN